MVQVYRSSAEGWCRDKHRDTGSRTSCNRGCATDSLNHNLLPGREGEQRTLRLAATRVHIQCTTGCSKCVSCGTFIVDISRCVASICYLHGDGCDRRCCWAGEM